MAPEREGIGVGQLAGLYRLVGQDEIVHLRLDRLERGRVDRAVMGEVEPETLRLHQGALLPHVGAEPSAQHVVHQMGRAVVALDIVAPGCVDRGVERRRLELRGKRSAHDRALGVLAHRCPR